MTLYLKKDKYNQFYLMGGTPLKYYRKGYKCFFTSSPTSFYSVGAAIVAANKDGFGVVRLGVTYPAPKNPFTYSIVEEIVAELPDAKLFPCYEPVEFRPPKSGDWFWSRFHKDVIVATRDHPNNRPQVIMKPKAMSINYVPDGPPKKQKLTRGDYYLHNGEVHTCQFDWVLDISIQKLKKIEN